MARSKSGGKTRKEMRESRGQLDANPRRLQRTEVELFAAGIAHEFNNVLGAALGHAEWALDSQEPADMKEALALVIKACERAREITWALKGLAQPREERIEVMDLARLVGSVGDWASPILAQDRIAFTASAPAKLRVRGDHDQLKEVLINLVKNAREAIYGSAGAAIDVRCEKHGQEVWISVSDSGNGVPEEFREVIFQPFFTTKGSMSHVGAASSGGAPPLAPTKVGGGMGLGLYMARNAALEHGGDLTLGAKPSEFLLKLPIFTE
ncbi:MAG TPA: HAMP domain-containing sensor histidine kinase [Bdellovibrionota bacterium]|jgi:signal transduction histidine kinase|nr:HAMP domain-containing sensor histidine kinase [Bdellovibrionota bacterium]